MGVEGRLIVRSVIVFVLLLNGERCGPWASCFERCRNSKAVNDYYKCDGVKAVLDLGVNHKSIYSHCNCTITTNFSGELVFVQNCITDILIQNHSGATIRLLCKDSKIHSGVNVAPGGKLLTISTQIKKPLYESTILNQKIQIFTPSYTPGLFSVICGSALGDLPTHRTSTSSIATTDTIKTTKFYTSTNKTTGVNVLKTSLNTFSTGTKASTSFAFPKAFTTKNAKILPISGLEYVVAAAAAGGVVVTIVITILVVLFLRRRNKAHSKNNENTREAGTNHNTNNPADVIYHSHQGNADGDGYSTCRLETRNLREELPANPLYQSYEENSAVDPLTPLQIKEDIYQSVSENVQYSHSAVDPHTSLQVMEDIYHRVPENVPDNNSVYSYAKPFQCSNKELNLVESQNDNVYAQVSKPKKK